MRDQRDMKGLNWEISSSASIHNNPNLIPTLVSMDFLRSYNAGQVDLCVFNLELNCFEIIECKDGGYLKYNQKKRLYNSAKLLSHIFDKSVLLKICQSK